MRPLPLTSPLAGSGLPLALGGSLLLHLGVLFGIPAHAPAAAHTAYVLEARLAPAVTAPTPRPAAEPESQASPSQPAPPRPRPHQAKPPRTTLAAQPEATPKSAVLPPTPESSAAAPPPVPVAVASTHEPEISSSTYYEGDQLDVPPQLLGEVQQIYPRRARTEEIEGVVTLSLLIDEQGRVDDIKVVDAKPPGYFEQAALDMLRRQRFSPALIHHHPVKSRWRTTVRYRLQS